MRMSVMKKIIIILVGIVLITIAFYQYNQKDGLAKNDKVYVEDFKGKMIQTKYNLLLIKQNLVKLKQYCLMIRSIKSRHQS